MHEDKIFYCNICAQHAKANQSIVPHITLHSTANQELGHNLDLILDDIEEILPAGPEEDERHLNMSMAADLEVIILFFLPLPLIFDRPGVAGAVLQTASLLINSLSHSSFS